MESRISIRSSSGPSMQVVARYDRSGAKRTAVNPTRPRIYGVARKSAPDEHGYEVKERGVQFDVPRNCKARGGITSPARPEVVLLHSLL